MNKSTRKFTIVSGIYLFILTFLLLTQPVIGYTATIEQILFNYALYLPLWIVTALTVFIAIKYADKKWIEFAFGKRTLFWTIILFVIVGFVLNFDYQRLSGCFNEDEDMFSTAKFIISISSIVLLSSGFYFSDTKLGTSLLIMEFLFWTIKVLYFSSSLDLLFPGYFTMICWIFRFVLIFKTLNEHTADKTAPNTKTNR